MKIYDYSSIEKLYVIGDIHGDFKPFFNIIKRSLKYNKEKYIEEKHPFEIEVENEINIDRPLSHKTYFKELEINGTYNNSVIIVCGDCGFGFNKFQYYIDILTKANELFSETNTHIIFVRGNHDDPSYFTNELINMSNIKTVPDYSVIKTMETNTLCVGGAISVDRLWRKQQEHRINKYSQSKDKKLYWDNEPIIVNENILNELRENNIQITSVVTHTCPSFSFPTEKDSAIGWLKMDENLKKDLDDERNSMTWLYEELIKEHKLFFWSYGHFHLDFSELINDIAFIANADNLSIIQPMKKYACLKYKEKMEKATKKRKRRARNKDIPSTEDLLIDDIVEPIRHNQDIPIYGDDGEPINGPLINNNIEEIHNRIDELIYNEGYGVNNNVDAVLEEVEEAPF